MATVYLIWQLYILITWQCFTLSEVSESAGVGRQTTLLHRLLENLLLLVLDVTFNHSVDENT